MQIFSFEYSWILMKTLEINEKSQKNQGVVLTKLIISHLIIALEYQTWYQSNAKT